MPYLRTINRLAAEVSCPTCGTVYAVDRDEDGGAECDTDPCHDDECQKRLCAECRIECDGCGLTFCRKHITEYSGEFYCGECMKGNHDQSLDLEPETDQRRIPVNA